MVVYSTGLFKRMGKEQRQELFLVPFGTKAIGQGYNKPPMIAQTNVMTAPFYKCSGDKWTIYAASIHSPQGTLPSDNHARWRLCFGNVTFHQGHLHLYQGQTSVGPYELSNQTNITAVIDLDTEYPISETGLELTISLWINTAVQIG